MDETPEQILARLQRHAESLRSVAAPAAPRPSSAAAPSPPPAPARPGGSPGAQAPSSAGLPSRRVLDRLADPAPPAEPAVNVVVWQRSGASDLLPEAEVRTPRFGVLARTVAGQIVGVIACILALLAWVRLGSVTAAIVICVLAAAGAVAALRRVPLCGWCAAGLLTGLALGRFS